MSESTTQSDQRPDVEPPVVSHGEADQSHEPAPPELAPEASIVRAAQPQDEAGIMALCRLMHAETGFTDLDEDLALSVLQHAWTMDRILIGVIGPVGAPVACACVALTTLWNSKGSVLDDFMTFVHPDHRRSRHARNLLLYVKKAADTLGLPLTMTMIGGSSKAKLYQRVFGDPAGVCFIYKGRPEQPPAIHDGVA